MPSLPPEPDWLQPRNNAALDDYQQLKSQLKNQLKDELKHRVRKGTRLARKGFNVFGLLAMGGCGLAVLGPALVGSGIGMLMGNTAALFAFLVALVLSLFGAYKLIDAAKTLKQTAITEMADQISASNPEDTETALRKLWHQNAATLPDLMHAALAATVRVTYRALYFTADDVQANRDRFDVQQAVHEDLPELLNAYAGSPKTAQTEQHLLQQLYLIEQRMSDIVADREQLQHDRLQAHGRYLKDKYQGGTSGHSGVPAPDFSVPLQDPSEPEPVRTQSATQSAKKSVHRRSELDID